MRVAGVAGRGVHQSAAGAHTGQRARDHRWRAALHRLPELRVPDLRDTRFVLHTADGHDNRVLQDLPGGPQDRAGGAPGAEPPGEQPLLSGDQCQERRWPGRVQNRGAAASPPAHTTAAVAVGSAAGSATAGAAFATGPWTARAPGQQQRQHRHNGRCRSV